MFDLPAMLQLDDETLPAFLTGRGLGLVLFGSHNGKPTLAQARVFDRRGPIRLGYIDALRCVAANKSHAVRFLPTLLVVRDGRVLAKLEGFHDRARLDAALTMGAVASLARAA